jgi:hypothetical protein
MSLKWSRKSMHGHDGRRSEEYCFKAIGRSFRYGYILSDSTVLEDIFKEKMSCFESLMHMNCSSCTIYELRIGFLILCQLSIKILSKVQLS